MTAPHVGEKVCHPVVVVKVNGVKCRALLDTGATGTYISALLVDLLKAKPARTLTRGIKTIMGLVTKRIETYHVKISDSQGRFTLPVCATKIEQRELLLLENPNFCVTMDSLLIICPTIYQSSHSVTLMLILQQLSLRKVLPFATSLVKILMHLTTFCVNSIGIL